MTAARLLSVVRDINERRSIEQELRSANARLDALVGQRTAELRASEARYERLFEFAPEAMVKTRNGVIALVNREAERLLGRDRSDLVGKEIGTVLPVLVGMDLVSPSCDSDERMRFSNVPLTRGDGAHQLVDMTVGPLDTETGPAHLIALRDASERNRLESQLQQAHTLEGVGRLAGGIAHDFNNLLTIISGYTQMLLNNLAPTDPNRADVEEISHASDSAAIFTQQLLALSRQQVLQPVRLDVNDFLRERRRLIERLVGDDIHVFTQFCDNLPAIVIDPVQLERVLLNLAANARDAMPGGGTLTIATRLAKDKKPRSSPLVAIAVSDTGSGIAPEVQKRIFEPFVSTKPSGRGTGLGLSIVRGIVVQSGGSVEVMSELGKGTTFRMVFPGSGAAAMPPSTRVQPSLPAVGGTEGVLVVDDNPALGELTKRMLERKGYRVFVAGNLQEVLALGDALNTVSVLLTDVLMADHSGPELVHELDAARRGWKVIYMSGFVRDAEDRSRIPADGLFIAKPFSRDQLLRAIRRALDG